MYDPCIRLAIILFFGLLSLLQMLRIKALVVIVVVIGGKILNWISYIK